ncbi:hypothetical protein G5714_024656 [Onychostoma macrolepis]|uniref:Uncharacterized protein n=1 Tax=Onychostoma macrolepis TaxID=369639 RepID=A0A7J6BHK7_9TELE|nr:hypothetical protein G5714_024656 [Onychostoma macrolepis]
MVKWTNSVFVGPKKCPPPIWVKATVVNLSLDSCAPHCGEGQNCSLRPRNSFGPRLAPGGARGSRTCQGRPAVRCGPADAGGESGKNSGGSARRSHEPASTNRQTYIQKDVFKNYGLSRGSKSRNKVSVGEPAEGSLQQCRDKAGPEKRFERKKDARARGGGGEGEVGGSGAVLPAHPVGLKTFNPKKSRNTGCGKVQTARVRFRPASSGPFHRLSPSPTGGEGGASSAARGPEVLPPTAGGSEPLRCPRRDLQLSSVGGASFWWEGSLRLSSPLGAGGGGDTSARFCEDRGLDPQLSRRRADAVVERASISLVPPGREAAATRPLGSARTGVSTPNSRADGRTPSLWGDASVGFPAACVALGGDRLDSGQPPVPLGIAERPPRPPPSTTSEVNGWGPHGLPEDSTRRVRVGPVGARGSPSVGTAARPLARPPSAHFFRGGAPRPAPVWPGRVGGRRWLAASGSRALQSPHAPTLPLTPGVVGSVLAPSLLPTGEGRGPSLPVCASTGADCPQSVSDRAAPSGRGSGPRKGCSRSAARSATHPTRLETRTKESNARASQRVSSSPHGAMKVKAGARRSRWDPPAPAGGAPPARLARTAGQVELERVRWYPKDGELCLGRAKPEETLVEARSGPDVQIGRPTWV